MERNGKIHARTGAPVCPGERSAPGFSFVYPRPPGAERGFAQGFAPPDSRGRLFLHSVRSEKTLKVRGQKRGLAMRGNWHENRGHRQHSIKSVGEGSGEFRSQKVDVQLKITKAVHAVDDE
jgi:hypothetical protein